MLNTRKCPSSLWSPLNLPDNDGIVATMCSGVYVFDNVGNKFFDAYSGLWNVNLGYSNDKIKDAMKKQIDVMPFVNPLVFCHENALQLSKIICDMIGCDMEKVFFSCTGSEAVEVALKVARKYNIMMGKGRKLIAVFGNSYHGTYYGSMSASNFEGGCRAGLEPLLEGFISLGVPYQRKAVGQVNYAENEKKLLTELHEFLSQHSNDIGAILIEPIIGSGGVITPPTNYIKALSDYCQAHNVLMICDEIACGFGRSGHMFGFQHFNLEPDIVLLSKGINNGYAPIGATCINKKIVNLFRDNEGFLFHLSTQNLNPISIAASLANIGLYNEELLHQITLSSSFWQESLKEIASIKCVNNIRVQGLMIAIDFTDKNHDILPLIMLQKLIYNILKNGVIVGDSYIANTLSSILLFPPYIATKQEIRRCVCSLKRAIIETFPE